MSVRTRTQYRNELTSGNHGMTRAIGTPDTWEFNSTAFEYTRRDQAFIDIVGSKGMFHPCSNIIVFRSPGTPDVYQEEVLFGDPPTFAYFGDFVGTIPGGTALEILPDDVYSKAGLLPDGEAQGFTRRAFNRLLDQMPETVSLVNFILELRDLKSMLTKVASQLKNPAGLYLSWHFGWLPLIRDIQAILTTAARIGEQLDHLKRVNKRTVTMSYTEKHNFGEGPLTFNDLAPTWMHDPSNDAWQVSEGYCIVRMNCGVHYDFDEAFETALSYLKSALAAFGLTNPALVVWNAIPFSFVVDWVFNVSTFLEDWEIQPFEGTIVINSASCSFTTYSRVAHKTVTYKPLIGPWQFREYGSTQVFGYHRRHGTPEGDIDLTGLTPFQQSLAAALLLAQGKSFPTRRPHI